MYNLPNVAESAETLERLVRKEKDAQIQRRFQMLLLLKTGEAKSRSGAARQLDVHRHTVSDWLELYEEGGIEKIQEVGDPGPEPGQESIPPEVVDALEDRLAEPEGPKQLHRDSAVARRGARNRASLFDRSWDRALRNWCETEGASAQPSKKNQQEQIEFQEELPDCLSSLNADKPIRLFCQDECRIGLMPTVRHRITLSGVKPIQTAKPAYEYFYLYGAVEYGAVEPDTGQRFPAEHERTEHERLNSNCFQDFLDRFSKAFAQSHGHR